MGQEALPHYAARQELAAATRLHQVSVSRSAGGVLRRTHRHPERHGPRLGVAVWPMAPNPSQSRSLFTYVRSFEARTLCRWVGVSATSALRQVHPLCDRTGRLPARGCHRRRSHHPDDCGSPNHPPNQRSATQEPPFWLHLNSRANRRSLKRLRAASAINFDTLSCPTALLGQRFKFGTGLCEAS